MAHIFAKLMCAIVSYRAVIASVCAKSHRVTTFQVYILQFARCQDSWRVASRYRQVYRHVARSRPFSSSSRQKVDNGRY